MVGMVALYVANRCGLVAQAIRQTAFSPTRAINISQQLIHNKTCYTTNQDCDQSGNTVLEAQLEIGFWGVLVLYFKKFNFVRMVKLV
jgi:hypothetical protein